MMSPSPSGFEPDPAHEARGHDRTHLFLGAVLHSRAGSCPVHIRNISPTGALIEGSIIPDKGEPMVLKRARLQASATIVWKAGRKAGIAFASRIHVSDWTSKPSNARQASVDGMIHAIRSGSPGHPGERSAVPPAEMLKSELEAVKSYLAELEQGLTADVVVVATHPEMQLIDVALQSVERVLASLRQQ